MIFNFKSTDGKKYLLLTGGTVNGDIIQEVEADGKVVHRFKSGLREIAIVIQKDGKFQIYDVTNNSDIFTSDVDGKNAFRGTATECLPKSGGYITGAEAGIGDRNSESGYTWGLKNSKRFITEQIMPDGTYRIRDTNNDKAIIKSTVDGTTTFEGTASGNLPKTGGQIDSPAYEPLKINSTLETAGAVYIAFKICGTNMGQLGVTKNGEPVFYATDGSGSKKLLHDGNSAKVVISETAPADTSALWVY